VEVFSNTWAWSHFLLCRSYLHIKRFQIAWHVSKWHLTWSITVCGSKSSHRKFPGNFRTTTIGILSKSTTKSRLIFVQVVWNSQSRPCWIDWNKFHSILTSYCIAVNGFRVTSEIDMSYVRLICHMSNWMRNKWQFWHVQGRKNVLITKNDESKRL
jgi:hypothetical protein